MSPPTVCKFSGKRAISVLFEIISNSANVPEIALFGGIYSIVGGCSFQKWMVSSQQWSLGMFTGQEKLRVTTRLHSHSEQEVSRSLGGDRAATTARRRSSDACAWLLDGASLIIQKFSESFSGSLKRETGSKLSPPNLPPIIWVVVHEHEIK